MLEILGKIGFDWQVALANFINFVVIFFILKKFAFKPIHKIITERQNKIETGLENAQKAEANLIMADEIKNHKIEEARLKSNQIISTAQEKSDAILTDTKNKSLKTKENMIAEGNLAIAESKKNIKKEVEKEISSMIIQGVEKVLKENLTEEMQKSYIKKSLKAYSQK
jgi:F-type H+-transporting ATPase subunit b